MHYRKPEDPNQVIGRTYGHLKVLSLHSTETVNTQYGDKIIPITENRFLCKCLLCGKEIVVWEHHLKSDVIRSCGCRTGVPPKDYTGERYGMLVADHRIDDINDYYYGMWVFNCDCGGTKISTPPALMQRIRKSPNSIVSCGCTSKQNRDEGNKDRKATRMKNTFGEIIPDELRLEYKRIWVYCYDKSAHSYKYIGGRGIKIDPIWYDPNHTKHNYNPMMINFVKWAKETGYKPGFKLERYDRDKDYGPDNCYWIEKKKADRHSSTMVRYNNRLYSLEKFDVEVLGRTKGYTSLRLRKVAPFYLEEIKAIIYELHHPERGSIHYFPATGDYRNAEGFQILMPKYEVKFYAD